MEIKNKEPQSSEHQSDQSAYVVWEDQSAVPPDVYTLNMLCLKVVFLQFRKDGLVTQVHGHVLRAASRTKSKHKEG
jgi:hypothetical protein